MGDPYARSRSNRVFTQEAVLGDTHAFNPSTILDLRLSYLRVFQDEFPDSRNVGLNQPLRRNAPPSFFYGQSTFAMRVPGDPKPYVQQWNAAVQRQIGNDASLTVAYAGSRGSHLLLQGWATVPNIGINQLPDQYFSMGPAALLAQVPNPFFGVITTPGSPLSEPTVAAGQLLRPYPQFERALALDPHRGRSNYRSLQTSFMKRFGEKGFLSVAYTWSQLKSKHGQRDGFPG